MPIISLPKALDSADEFSQLIERYKAFRLLSLKLSPMAFGSSYDREAAFTDDIWIGRLSSPLSDNLVAVAGQSADGTRTDADADSDSLFKQEWLACLLLRGPFDKEDILTEFRTLAIESPERILDEKIDHYLALYAMYVLPSARGEGYGTAIVGHAKKEALKLGQGAMVRVVLMLDSDNIAAQRTYAKCGFEVKFTYLFDDMRQGRTGKGRGTLMAADVGGAGLEGA